MHTVNFLIHVVENHQTLVYFLIFLGLIIEGDITLIATGLLAHLGAIHLEFAIIFVLVGAVCKTFLGYYVGTLVHTRWHHTKFMRHIEKKVYNMMPHFTRKPFWSIFVSKFIMGVNHAVIIFSGYKKINFKKYLEAESFSTVIWVPLLLSLGYFFSYTAIHVSHEIWQFGSVVLILFLMFVVIDRLISWGYEIFEEFYDKG